MSKPSPKPSIYEYATDESNPALANSAVARCVADWKDTISSLSDAGVYEHHISRRAAEAFCTAIPPLTDSSSIADFIACVAHGMLIGAIDPKNGSKLLYAAQVASAAIRTCPAPIKEVQPRAGTTEKADEGAKAAA